MSWQRDVLEGVWGAGAHLHTRAHLHAREDALKNGALGCTAHAHAHGLILSGYTTGCMVRVARNACTQGMHVCNILRYRYANSHHI